CGVAGRGAVAPTRALAVLVRRLLPFARRELVHLLAEIPRRLFEHVFDQRLERRCADRFLPGDRIADVVLDLRRERLALTSREPAALQEERLHPAQRIALVAPHLGDLLVAIA